MNNKKSFVVYSSWRSYFDLLDKSDQVKELLTAMFDLADGNEPNVTDDKVKIAYEAISQVMRKDIALYNAKCEKNKKAAEVRWENAGDMQTHADGMQTHANALHSHSDNEYAYDNDNDNDFDNEFEIVKASQGNTDTPSVSEVIKEAKKIGIDLPESEAEAFINYYYINGEGMIKGQPIRNWKNLIKGWYSHSLVDPKDQFGDGLTFYDEVFNLLPKNIQDAIAKDQELYDGKLTRKTVDLIGKCMAERR